MADAPNNSRTASLPPFTKIFNAFRIALDLKKMALAGVGILATSLGWWLLCWLFYTPAVPQWKNYQGAFENDAEAWKAFRRDRARWNFLHRVAGPPTNDPAKAVPVDAGDVAKSLDQFQALQAVLHGRLRVGLADGKLTFDGVAFEIKAANDAEAEELKKLASTPIVDVVLGDENEKTIVIAGKKVVLEEFERFRILREGVRPATALSQDDRELFAKTLDRPVLKNAGLLRTCPWNEDRGPNPYLLALSVFEGKAFTRGEFFTWLFHDQLPVLAEPLVKFVAPVFFLFERDAGGWRNSSLLIFVILWNLVVWGYFGGAICRLAAVQFARNEKIPLGEVAAFLRPRYKHFVVAPVLPLVCLFLMTVALGLFGLATGWTHLFGDIVIAGFLWPLVILIGLIMAVLLVGLFAWPLMYPTIAVEGSDAFDALSRSYSYLYQRPWQFLGYSITALAYGAVVVFFVGFMGSLMVYLGQWGFSKAPWLASEDATRDRTPAYFFQYAPTSFGWRDLFLHDSPWARPVETPPAGIGTSPVRYELTPEYHASMGLHNRIGAWLVTMWLGITFLLVLGFGYSYFWTASTILYFLLRKLVDDTEFDEIHLDEDVVPPPPPPLREFTAPPQPPAAKPGTVSLNVVDPPKPS